MPASLLIGEEETVSLQRECHSFPFSKVSKT